MECLPAQYGYRTSGVIEIQTKNGCDGGHNNFSCIRRHVRYGRAEFPASGLQWQVQLLFDRTLFAFQLLVSVPPRRATIRFMTPSIRVRGLPISPMSSILRRN